MKTINVFLAILFLLLSGCQQAEPEATSEAFVEANSAYLRHFGQPPQVKEGRAFALVGYFPLLKDPARVKPMPLYLFSEAESLEQILSRLIGGELILAEGTLAYDPFAGKINLKRLAMEESTAEIYLRRLHQDEPHDLSPLVRSLTETACQFESVERVKLWLDDQPFPNQPEAGFQSQPEAIVPVGDPQLLLAAGVWESDAAAPKELMISFDRPISVNSFRVLNEAGEQISGNYFISMFNMAVMIHPKQPEAFGAGTPLNVVWDVTDQLGRRNSGIDKLELRRLDHR